MARWGQTGNSVGKAGHHDGWAVVQGESRHTKSRVEPGQVTAQAPPPGPAANERSDEEGNDQSSRLGAIVALQAEKIKRNSTGRRTEQGCSQHRDEIGVRDTKSFGS